MAANGARTGIGEEQWMKPEILWFLVKTQRNVLTGLNFELKGVVDVERLQAEMVAIDGRALSWFQWWEFFLFRIPLGMIFILH